MSPLHCYTQWTFSCKFHLLISRSKHTSEEISTMIHNFTGRTSLVKRRTISLADSYIYIITRVACTLVPRQPTSQPTTPVKNVWKVYSLYPSPLFNVEVCPERLQSHHIAYQECSLILQHWYGVEGAHKHFLCTYRLDLFKSCCNQGVHFQPSQLFLSGVVAYHRSQSLDSLAMQLRTLHRNAAVTIIVLVYASICYFKHCTQTLLLQSLASEMLLTRA